MLRALQKIESNKIECVNVMVDESNGLNIRVRYQFSWKINLSKERSVSSNCWAIDKTVFSGLSASGK